MLVCHPHLQDYVRYEILPNSVRTVESDKYGSYKTIGYKNIKNEKTYVSSLKEVLRWLERSELMERKSEEKRLIAEKRAAEKRALGPTTQAAGRQRLREVEEETGIKPPCVSVCIDCRVKSASTPGPYHMHFR